MIVSPAIECGSVSGVGNIDAGLVSRSVARELCPNVVVVGGVVVDAIGSIEVAANRQRSDAVVERAEVTVWLREECGDVQANLIEPGFRNDVAWKRSANRLPLTSCVVAGS